MNLRCARIQLVRYLFTGRQREAYIVSHAARALPCHYPCHGTTPLIFENIDFQHSHVVSVYLRFLVNALNRSPATASRRRGLEHSSLHSIRATRVLDVVPRGYSRLHLFSFVLEELRGENVTVNEIVT